MSQRNFSRQAHIFGRIAIALVLGLASGAPAYAEGGEQVIEAKVVDGMTYTKLKGATKAMKVGGFVLEGKETELTCGPKMVCSYRAPNGQVVEGQARRKKGGGLKLHFEIVFKGGKIKVVFDIIKRPGEDTGDDDGDGGGEQGETTSPADPSPTNPNPPKTN